MDGMISFFSVAVEWFLKVIVGMACVMLVVAVVCTIIYFDPCENNKVCIIEYMDGDKDEIECWHAGENSSFFSSPSVLEVHRRNGNTIIKSLATIKRWHCVKKEKTK